VLLEVRSEGELEEALQVEGAVIGVNSRNLETLAIDPSVTRGLLPRIPAGRIAVAESGLSSRDDVERVADLGADAVLVGSSLSAAPDPVGAVRALAGVRRMPRGG
jgi:indole-3-glycerol phosphate synthase